VRYRAMMRSPDVRKQRQHVGPLICCNLSSINAAMPNLRGMLKAERKETAKRPDNGGWGLTCYNYTFSHRPFASQR
jgi:hypothetical protein